MTDLKKYLNSTALLTVSLLLGFAAFLTFPLYDDGWLTLLLRESAPQVLLQNMGDRPIFALILVRLVSLGLGHKVAFVLLNSALWLVFAIEAKLLFEELFPEFKNYSTVSACATLAPIVVQTQLSTVVVSIPANLASILSYAALLIVLKERRVTETLRAFPLAAAALLAGTAVMLSEYGVATNLVAMIVLIGVLLGESSHSMRRQMSYAAAALFAVTVGGYFVFNRIANYAIRPDVTPEHALHRSLFQWMEIPFDVVTGVWHSSIAAYSLELGKITLGWDSKSTLVGVVFGCLLATLLFIGSRTTPDRLLREDKPRPLALRLSVFAMGLVIGLLPFKVMGRATNLLEFGSRFRIPILPLASALTLALALSVVRPALRWVPVVTLGFLIGYASWTFSYVEVQNHRAIANYGKAIAPYMARSAGNTVAIVPLDRMEYELTAAATLGWPLESEKRLWVIGEGLARRQYGSRTACRDIVLEINNRGLMRSGTVEQVLWVEGEPGKPVRVEPYCFSENPSQAALQ